MAKRLLANINEDTFKLVKRAFIDRGETMQDAIVKATLNYLGINISLEEATKERLQPTEVLDEAELIEISELEKQDTLEV